jgi:hypothetical protein
MEEDTGGSNANQPTPEADVPVNHALYSTARILTAAEIMAKDANVQQITPADDRLIRVYGDTTVKMMDCTYMVESTRN